MSLKERLFHALIRTHHITSRKKVAKLKQAADFHHVFALLRSGGAPGIMYVEGEERGVRQWVDAVHVKLHVCFDDQSTRKVTSSIRTCDTKTTSSFLGPQFWSVRTRRVTRC